MLSNIRLIEIEIHSYCNRKCNWCPNKFIDRNFYKELPEDIFLKILNELKENNFGKNYEKPMITFSRFNEPTYNIDLLNKRIKQTKQILPYIETIVNTNGDYLTKENLNKISPYLDELSIMDYNCKGYKKCKNKKKRN
jgi:pyruvate-formate lyase-activating enzyme